MKYKTFVSVLLIFLLVPFVCKAEKKDKKPKNIIIMIADGWGYNQILATDYYMDGKAGTQKYESFPYKYAMAHYPAKSGNYDADPEKCHLLGNTGYNPDLAWTMFEYVKSNVTESAAAATALACGVKTYNNAIGVDTNQHRLENLSERAKSVGKSAGVITTVPWSHATPAGFSVHNNTRVNYAEIARDMLLDSKLDLIMGAGHPMYDDNGNKLSKAESYKYVGDSLVFTELIKNTSVVYPMKSNTGNNKVQDIDGDGFADAWTYIESKDDFIKLSKGANLPKRLCATAQVGSTLQEYRDYDSTKHGAFQIPFNKNLPDLPLMAKGAVNVLSQNPNGFFLMIEGGAVDWANHDNKLGRLVEEMNDFNKTVDFVVKWIEANGGWENNLLIVTGDHECGYLTGPKIKDNNPNTNPVINRGKNIMPEARYNLGSHTNSLIPVFAKGNGASMLSNYADEMDPIRGKYIQNIEVAKLIFEMLGK